MEEYPLKKSNIKKDFFISYTNADRAWAEWIAWQLEQEGFTTIIQAWDFHAGSNFVNEMNLATQHAVRTIAVLSPDYFQSRFTPAEWQEAFRRDPTSEEGILLPIRIRSCDVQGLLGSIVYIDLVGLDERTARERLLVRVRHERAKPATSPTFPGMSSAISSDLLPPAFPGIRNQYWTVPYQRNPLFTGREVELKAIEEALNLGQNAAISQAISGLGGIGKTQLALEYAYRHREEYRYIFWVLADTINTLNTEYSKIAELLDLPAKSQAEQRFIVEAVKNWLEKNHDWLLILDNADDLEVLNDFIPTNPHGRILLTTRAHALGRLAKSIEIKKLSKEESSQFLLHRSSLLVGLEDFENIANNDFAALKEIIYELDGLPLALDQAGAYIEETSCGLQGYLKLYKKERKELLKLRGGVVVDHPEPIATTWKISFEKVEKADPAAADLLRLCAFLAPDDIPEMIIVEGEAELTAPLKKLARRQIKLNAAIAALQKFSLVSRDSTIQAISIHRLVQAVLRDSMTKNVERAWAVRVVRTIHRVFPWGNNVNNWERCRQLLPHVQECAKLIESWQIDTNESANLLDCAGLYLHDRAEYNEAGVYVEKSLTISQKILGAGNVITSLYMIRLADIYRHQGRYEQASNLAEQALAIQQAILGSGHEYVLSSLNNLALIYKEQGKYEKAEATYQQSLATLRKNAGETEKDTMIFLNLNNLGELYHAQAKYVEAENFYQQALIIEHKVLGQEDPKSAHILNNLGKLYQEQEKYEDALPFFEQALTIRKEKLGAEHPDTKITLENYEETLRKLKEKSNQ